MYSPPLGRVRDAKSLTISARQTIFMHPIHSIDWFNAARFLCVLSFLGYALKSNRIIGFFGMIWCSFLFMTWEQMASFPFDTWPWISSYVVLSGGFFDIPLGSKTKQR